jgi:signal transduction histidine kinase/CheY-like chemotaxis protein
MASELAPAELRVEQVRLLYRQTPIALGVNVAVAGLAAAALGSVEPASRVGLWFGLTVAAACFRGAVYLAYRRADPRNARAHPWDKLAMLGSGVSGLLWGLGLAVLFPHDPIHQVMVCLTIGGMCTGAVVVHASHLPTLLAFLLPAILPVAARFLMEGMGPDAALAGMMIVFVLALSVAGYNFNRALVERLRLRGDLERRMRELDAAGTRLTQETQERLTAQETVRQLEKMDALGQLTGGIAHDFNNLLTAVIGNLERIDNATPARDKRKTLIQAALRSAEHGAQLTKQLLSFARKQPLQTEVVEVGRALTDFVSFSSRPIGDDVTVTLSLTQGLWLSRLDPAQLQTALLNLAINARDAMPKGGRVVIAARNATVGAGEVPDLPPGDYVRISVEDTGRGMTPAVLARAFEPFFTTKGAGKGSGLGLSMVYGFAKQSGGALRVRSVLGAGTTVELFLPRSLAPQREAQRAAHAATPASQETAILVVDDDEDVRRLSAGALRDLGYRVFEAGGAADAIALLQHRSVDLLFSDVVMPGGMNGLELSKEARKIQPGLAVLLTTGYADSFDRSPPDGELQVLAKPFRPSDLAKRIREILNHS